MTDAIIAAMFARVVRALASGIAVGIVLQESVWLALDPIDPLRSLHVEWTRGPQGDGWLVPLIAAWLIGGGAGGLMAALVGRNRWLAHAVGALLCASAGLLLTLAWPDAGAAKWLALTPALGAAAGAAMAGYVLADDEHGGGERVATLRADS
jgi:hypothetical protein